MSPNLLEPYWDDVDRIVEKDLVAFFNEKHFKYFRATRLKLKALRYLQCRVEDRQSEYRCHIKKMLGQGNTKNFSSNSDGSMSYYPFFLAIEFENLLTQAKACLDCFSKSAGVIFKDFPNKLLKLEKVLQQRRSGKDPDIARVANDILRHIEAKRSFLNGIVLDPGASHKSIRDLISHYQEAPVHFEIKSPNKISYALVRFDSSQVIHLPNYRVVWISKQVWHQCRNMILGSYKVIRDFKKSQQR